MDSLVDQSLCLVKTIQKNDTLASVRQTPLVLRLGKHPWDIGHVCEPSVRLSTK